MSAYCLFDSLEATDLGKLEDYQARAADVVNRYGGRYVVLGGRVDRVEGEWQPSFRVMIELASLAQAHRWYGSDAYRALEALRLSAGRFSGVFCEGLRPAR